VRVRRSVCWLSAVIACAAATAAQASIIQGPVVYEDHTYVLLDTATWTQSEQQAVALGGHLVTINDAAENAWVLDTFVTTPGRSIGLWLGLTDQDVEGTFVWVNGEPVTYTNWRAGEPNNYLVNDPVHGEDYGMMYGYGAWNDTDNTGQDQAPLHGVVEVVGPVVPEPATGLLTLAGLSLLAGGRRAGRRARSTRLRRRRARCRSPASGGASPGRAGRRRSRPRSSPARRAPRPGRTPASRSARGTGRAKATPGSPPGSSPGSAD
jgi:hypothetical protein